MGHRLSVVSEHCQGLHFRNHHRRALGILMQGGGGVGHLLGGATPMLSMGDDRTSHHKPVLDIAVFLYRPLITTEQPARLGARRANILLVNKLSLWAIPEQRSKIGGPSNFNRLIKCGVCKAL